MARVVQEACFWKGRVRDGSTSDETHEKEMKQLRFSPWYKNISGANLPHLSSEISLSSQVIGQQTNEKMRLYKANSWLLS